MPTRVSLSSSDDPLTRAMAPPEDETDAQREERLVAEQDAKRVSDAIDEEISRQRMTEKAAGRPVKILLLGQSESGKSTTLKNFQLMNSSKAFRAERAQWRTVIQLNVVRSIRLILEAMVEAQGISTPPPMSPRLRPSDAPSDVQPAVDPSIPHLTSEHLLLKMKLSPLLQVEDVLLRQLDPGGSADFDAAHLTSLTNIPYANRSRKGFKEVAVNSRTWGAKFSRLLNGDDRRSLEGDGQEPEADEPAQVLHACSDDMIRLWNDPTIRDVLDQQKLRMEEMPGFFLDSLERVTSLRYMPSDDDIIRARIKTLGVTEYQFTVKAGNTLNHDWRIYDVGGQRSLVTAWVPYFDDMDAIIFLAPISCFDQVLEEDPSVNRLEDSVLLWKSIVSHPLLAKTNIILFLNKCDILRRKLASGIKLSRYIISYGDRPNDFDTSSTYLRRKFAQIHKDHSPQKRVFYSHFTSVVDTQSTLAVLTDVQEIVLRSNLQGTYML